MTQLRRRTPASRPATARLADGSSRTTRQVEYEVAPRKRRQDRQVRLLFPPITVRPPSRKTPKACPLRLPSWSNDSRGHTDQFSEPDRPLFYQGRLQRRRLSRQVGRANDFGSPPGFEPEEDYEHLVKGGARTPALPRRAGEELAAAEGRRDPPARRQAADPTRMITGCWSAG
jgi:hypothetical protein